MAQQSPFAGLDLMGRHRAEYGQQWEEPGNFVTVRDAQGNLRNVPRDSNASDSGMRGFLNPGDVLSRPEDLAWLDQGIRGGDAWRASAKGYSNMPPSGLGLEGAVRGGWQPYRFNDQGELVYDPSAMTQINNWSDPSGGGFGGFAKDALSSPVGAPIAGALLGPAGLGLSGTTLGAATGAITGGARGGLSGALKGGLTGGALAYGAGQLGDYLKGTELGKSVSNLFGTGSSDPAGVGSVQNYSAPPNEFGGASYGSDATTGLEFDAMDTAGGFGDLGNAANYGVNPLAGAAGAGTAFTAAELANSKIAAPYMELGPNGELLSSGGAVPTASLGGSNLLGSLGAGATVAGGAKSLFGNGGSSNADTVSKFLKDNLGIDISSGALGLLGTGLATGLGVYGANQQSNAADANTQLQREIYNNERAALQPSRDYYNNLLQNPDIYYQSKPAIGSSLAAARTLSSKFGNIDKELNPGAFSQLGAYNLGGYNNALNAAAGRAGLGNSASIAGLGGQYGNSIIGQGQAAGQLPNALGYGLSSLLNTRPNYYTG